MVETIDRHGLQSRFLKHHLASVDRFYERLCKLAPRSEVASKSKQRFEKNRHTLFTFLSHDGVPWNNNNAEHAIKAFATLLEAVDYLLKPLDPEQVTEAVNRLLAYLRPFEAGSSPSSGDLGNGVPTADKMRLTGAANELLPVKDVDRDQIRLLARREVVAVLRRERRTWVHTVREDFATYYPVADLLRWLGGDPFVQIGRHAVVNLQAIERVIHYGDRLYRVRLRDRVETEITASRTGAARLAAVLKTGTLKEGTRATSYTDL